MFGDPCWNRSPLTKKNGFELNCGCQTPPSDALCLVNSERESENLCIVSRGQPDSLVMSLLTSSTRNNTTTPSTHIHAQRRNTNTHTIFLFLFSFHNTPPGARRQYKCPHHEKRMGGDMEFLWCRPRSKTLFIPPVLPVFAFHQDSPQLGKVLREMTASTILTRRRCNRRYQEDRGEGNQLPLHPMDPLN